MSKGSRSRRLPWWSGAVCAALCTGAAFVAQALLGEHPSTWTDWTMTLGGAAATMVAFLFGILPPILAARKDAEELAKETVTDYCLALRSILPPLTGILERIITAPNEISRAAAKGVMKQAVVNSLVQFADVPGARSRYLDYEQSILVCRGIHAGWNSKPRTEFSSANPDHAKILQLLKSRQSGLIEDVDIENPSRFPPKKRGRNAYIFAPVATSTEVFGLLSLDVLHVDNLKLRRAEGILLLAQLLAQLLGMALAINGSNGSL